MVVLPARGGCLTTSAIVSDGSDAWQKAATIVTEVLPIVSPRLRAYMRDARFLKIRKL